MSKKHKFKKLASRAWENISPTYRKAVQQERRLHKLEKSTSDISSAIAKLSSQNDSAKNEIARIIDSLEKSAGLLASQSKIVASASDRVEESTRIVGTLNKKFANTLYNKSNYFEIDSDLGVFTVKAFRDFLIENEEKIPDLVKELKESLDNESCAAIDLFLDRARYQLPERLPGGGAVLYRKDDLFTEDEQEPYRSGQVAAKAKAFRERYQIGANKTFLCPIFYESGLVFLSDEVLDTIKGSIAIDCGAYWGDTAIVFSEYGPSKVFAFEPVRYWHKEMQRIVELNNLSDVIVPVKKGVAGEIGELKITEGDTTSFLSDNGRGDSVEVVFLDHFVDPDWGRVGLIKYDVEGMDFDALQGTEQTIRRDRPILLTSIYHSPEHFFGIRKYIDSLGLGYKHKIRKLAKSPLCDLMLISWVE